MDAFAEEPLDPPVPESSTDVLEKPLLNRRTLLVAILVVLGAAICVYEGLIYSIPGRSSDFAVYFAAGQVAAGGGNPYQQEEIGRELKNIGIDSGIQEYLYSSSFLLLIQPLLSLSFRQAHRVFVLLTYLAVTASMLMIWRSVNRGAGTRLPLWGLFLLLVWFTPAWSNLTLTQVNGLVLLLVSACLYLITVRRDFWAGASLAGAIAIKFTPALLLFYFLFRRRWKALLGAAAAAVCLELVSWIYFGSLLDLNLPGALLGQTSRKLLYWNNLALPAVLARPFGEGSAWTGPVSLAASAVIGASTLLVTWKRRRDAAAGPLVFGLLVTAFLLIPAYLYGHHLIQLLIPLGIIAAFLPGAGAGMNRNLLMALLAGLGLAFLLIEADYWRVWRLLDLENWGWWAHPASWGLLLLWGIQMAILASPRLLAAVTPASAGGAVQPVLAGAAQPGVAPDE